MNEQALRAYATVLEAQDGHTTEARSYLNTHGSVGDSSTGAIREVWSARHDVMFKTVDDAVGRSADYLTNRAKARRDIADIYEEMDDGTQAFDNDYLAEEPRTASLSPNRSGTRLLRCLAPDRRGRLRTDEDGDQRHQPDRRPTHLATRRPGGPPPEDDDEELFGSVALRW